MKVVKFVPLGQGAIQEYALGDNATVADLLGAANHELSENEKVVAKSSGQVSLDSPVVEGEIYTTSVTVKGGTV